MCEELRDNKHLMHFKSRAQQPKISAPKYLVITRTPNRIGTTNEQGFNKTLSQADVIPFNHVGTDVDINKKNKMNFKRIKYNSARSAFM